MENMSVESHAKSRPEVKGNTERLDSRRFVIDTQFWSRIAFSQIYLQQRRGSSRASQRYDQQTSLTSKGMPMSDEFMIRVEDLVKVYPAADSRGRSS